MFDKHQDFFIRKKQTKVLDKQPHRSTDLTYATTDIQSFVWIFNAQHLYMERSILCFAWCS